ncbi:hypothetical protein GCM10022212_27230 [Actimicrobium antarcticum]|uniref:Uncharacterized protein n=1 Tax=Actimicrobium antarcticum TaxID=1051899 RepID=A0ABP7TKH0_9BURK
MRARIKASDAYIDEETIYELEGGGWGNIRGRLGDDPQDRKATLPRKSRRADTAAAASPVARAVSSDPSREVRRARPVKTLAIDQIVRMRIDALSQKQTKTSASGTKSGGVKRARDESTNTSASAIKRPRTPEYLQRRQAALDDYIQEETIYPLDGGGWGNIRGRLSVDPFARKEASTTQRDAIVPVADSAMASANVAPAVRSQSHRVQKWTPSLAPVPEQPVPEAGRD